MTGHVLLALCGLAAALWLLLMTRFGAAVRRVGALAPDARDGDPAPRISVVIPARDEEHDLEAGLRSVLAQQGVEVEVIVVDDHSSDRTGAIADRLAAADRRLRVLHRPPLEPGWLGKANAMQRGATLASGEYLLFTDADIVHEPRCFASAMGLLRDRDADLVSLVPRLVIGTFWENVIQPMYVAGFAQYANAAIDDPASPDAIASGALMLMKKSLFEELGGMTAVRSEMFDDVGLARLLKRNGRRVVTRLAPRLLRVQAFKNNRQAFWGTTKNVMMIGNGKPQLALAAVLISVLLFWAPWIAVVVGALRPSPLLIGAGLATHLFQFALLYGHGRSLARVRPVALLFFPLVVVVVTCCTLRALYHHSVRGTVLWRGRAIKVR
ncbi:MAG: glycosyltransferase [Deltaproteobacteria bacterium]|nr:glycosyltransferase [Deltaproteobacteria bacterium]